MIESVHRESEQLANEGTSVNEDGKWFPYIFVFFYWYFWHA